MPDPIDPLDQPEDDGMELVYPFVACVSEGGPYDDEAFAAGVQLGRIDSLLQVAAVTGADRLEPIAVRTPLVRQVELAAMARGFPVVDATDTEWSEWTTVTIARSER